MMLLAEEISHLDVNSDAIVKLQKHLAITPSISTKSARLYPSLLYVLSSRCALGGFNNPQPRV
jgi:hypothetical protein